MSFAPAGDPDFDVAQVRASLLAMGLVGADEEFALEPLAGGVSSLILHVRTAAREFCLKRALPQLRVASEWRAPVERSLAELAWLRFAAGVDARAVPQVLGADPQRMAFAMSFLAPDAYPVWKAQLRDGQIDTGLAAEVGRRLSRLHAASAAPEARTELASAFANDAQFHALRLEPYFVATAASHPDRAAPLQALVGSVWANRRALMHGDISPKNILAGPDGPVFLDAECACWGDPAFDLAFCLNHLLLKGAWHSRWLAGYLDAYRALVTAYLAGTDWEPAAALERRTVALIGGMLLARVDGRSPVEYLNTEAARKLVRGFARDQLVAPAASLGELAAAWSRCVAAAYPGRAGLPYPGRHDFVREGVGREDGGGEQ